MSAVYAMACQNYNEERYELHQGGEFTVERNYGTINQENREQELQVILQEDEDSDQGLVMHGGVSQLCTNEDISTFFRDGRRKIDFVLVYEENSAGRGGSVTSGWSSASLGSAGVDVGVGAGHNGPSDKRSTKHDMWRYRFMESLRRVGLDMEEGGTVAMAAERIVVVINYKMLETTEVVESSNKKLVYFIKLHATWPVLCHYAEELNMRAPLQAHPNPSMNWSEMILQILRLPNIMYEEVPNKPLDYYTCPFRKSKIDRKNIIPLLRFPARQHPNPGTIVTLNCCLRETGCSALVMVNAGRSQDRRSIEVEEAFLNSVER
uniref:Anoctamin dimerisation domain-containing protein n=1 Tax=Timema douglasi TaxID=61478 RepID=A0A7R8VLN7_TIMDO|nr:unnamed protein product [Timema douglasi]